MNDKLTESARRERESKEKIINIMKNFDRAESKLREEYEKKIRDLEYKISFMYFFKYRNKKHIEPVKDLHDDNTV